MRISVLTIFPELIASPLQEGIIRRAIQSQAIEIHITNIRDFATGKHAMTDDRPYGGGEGMVMKPEPLAAALKEVNSQQGKGHVILLSPQGRKYSQKVAEELAEKEHLILMCGRYEGVDERIRSHYIDEEISLGDYILTGGELAAMVVIDSVTRLLPGVLGCTDSADRDTFSRGGLKYPQYTRPKIFEGHGVPDVLMSGDHARIAEWRLAESVRITREKRPDLLNKMTFSNEELKFLRKQKLM